MIDVRFVFLPTPRDLLYCSAGFKDNLRAIALSMEALRAVERYGIVEGQQYRGFKALPAPAAQTREEKIAELAQNGATTGERDAAEAALKRINANPR